MFYVNGSTSLLKGPLKVVFTDLVVLVLATLQQVNIRCHLLYNDLVRDKTTISDHFPYIKPFTTKNW